MSGKVRILERLGSSARDLLSNPTPWKGLNCSRSQCGPCRSKEGTCKVKSVTYMITCVDCLSVETKSVYIGETNRTLGDRIGEHFSALEKQSSTSCLVKHWEEFHGGNNDPPGYSVKILGRHRSSTERQISEALAIEHGDHHNLLNSKSEWGMNSIPRQGVKFRDTLWEDRQSVPGGDRPGKNKRNRVGTDSVRDSETSEVIQNELFTDQYAQRRKRMRIDKETQSNNNDGDKVPSVSAADRSGDSRRQQTQIDAPVQTLVKTETEIQTQLETQRISLRRWLQSDEPCDT